MDVRKEYFKRHISNPHARILELGPLNYPVVLKEYYPNCRYCDIRSTEEVKSLYSGNSYLEATGIYVDTDTIVEIDDVIHESYTEFYCDEEKFDVVVASHVLEHMEDLISALLDIGGILKPNGKFCIFYPDKRYAFDHFRQSTSFRDAYNVYRNGVKYNAPMVLDFFLMAVKENDPFRFWNNENLEDLLLPLSPQKAIPPFEKAENGVRMPDVHYWPFTDWDFLLFLYECTKMGLLPYRCLDFVQTQRNTQQFMLLLEYDPKVKDDSKDAENILIKYLKCALPHFYTAQDMDKDSDIENARFELATAKGELDNIKIRLESSETDLENTKAELVATGNELDKTKIRLESSEADLENTKAELVTTGNELENARRELSVTKMELESTRIGYEAIKSSTIWKTTAPIRKIMDIIKQLVRNLLGKKNES